MQRSTEERSELSSDSPLLVQQPEDALETIVAEMGDSLVADLALASVLAESAAMPALASSAQKASVELAQPGFEETSDCAREA